MRGLTYDDKFLILMWGKMEYFQQHYIYPSQETLRDWLCNQGGLDVSIRTLNRYLRKLQSRQILGRIRRVKHNPKGGLLFATTLYSLGFLGLRRLAMIGVISWKQLRAYIKNSSPFRARQPKKQKKGLTPDMDGFYKDFTNMRDAAADLI